MIVSGASTSSAHVDPTAHYSLDALKALKAISYANVVARALEPIPGLEFTTHPARPTVNTVLEEKANRAREAWCGTTCRFTSHEDEERGICWINCTPTTWS